MSNTVYLVTVKDKNSYRTIQRVFSDKERAIDVMFDELLAIDLPMSRAISLDEKNEIKEKHLAYLKEMVDRHETDSGVDFTKETSHLFGSRKEPIDVVIGRVIETTIE